MLVEIVVFKMGWVNLSVNFRENVGVRKESVGYRVALFA